MSKRKKYAPRVPLVVMGGIRAQHVRSGALRAWWARRWIEALESFRIGARFGRGRGYAVAGQVSELEIKPGQVAAYVQGGGSEPYRSFIKFKMATGGVKEALVNRLQRNTILLARLLVGDLPVEVETICTEGGCNLFPRRDDDIFSRCSCPDYANPCKHLAAVYYLLGEAITHNPLLLLELRGITRVDLYGVAKPCATDQRGAPDALHAVPPMMAGAAVADVADFYGRPSASIEDFGKVVGSITNAPLIYRLGALPFWRGHEKFVDTLEHLYARAKPRGMAAWVGEELDLRREDEKVVVKGANLHLKGHRLRIDDSWTS